MSNVALTCKGGVYTGSTKALADNASDGSPCIPTYIAAVTGDAAGSSLSSSSTTIAFKYTVTQIAKTEAKAAARLKEVDDGIAKFWTSLSYKFQDSGADKREIIGKNTPVTVDTAAKTAAQTAAGATAMSCMAAIVLGAAALF